MRRQNTCIAILLCLAGAFFFVCGSPSSVSPQTGGWKERWEKVRAEAKKEGQVVVFGPPGELIRNAITEGFKRAFPEIGIEYSGARGPENATRIKAERDGGVYNVDLLLAGGSTGNVQVKPIGALDPIEPALILPEVTDPKNWRDNRLEFLDREGKYILAFVSQVDVPLIYNLEQVKVEEIDELYELLHPKWKGKIVINDPLPPGAGFVLFRHLWHKLGSEKATEYFIKIRAQAGAVDRDQRRQIEWVAQGKYAIHLAPSTLMHQLRERGLKFGVLGEFKDYGAHVTAAFGSAMLINKAPHPSAAKAFLNWLLSREGQMVWSKAMGDVSRRLDVPTDHVPRYLIPKLGVKYWNAVLEDNVHRSPEEEKILRELFGR